MYGPMYIKFYISFKQSKKKALQSIKMTHRHFQEGFSFQQHRFENLWFPPPSRPPKKTDPVSETFVLFGILDDGQNLEIWQHHVISWHPVPLELVGGVQMNTIYSLRMVSCVTGDCLCVNCVTGDCLCVNTAYCVFDESPGWYFLEDTSSQHISLYLEVKLFLLPFYHPRVCIVKYSTSSVIPYSPWSFISFWRIFLLLQLVLLLLSFFVLYGLIHELYPSSWRMKDQLDVACYFISLLMCSTCFGH